MVKSESSLSSMQDILKLRELKRFPLVDGVRESKYAAVYPLMQKEVKTIVEVLSNYNVEIKIFGSSVTMLCNITSDLDVCIRTKDTDLELFYEIQKIILKSVSVECDVIYYNSLSECDKIKCEIDEKGIVMKEMI